MSDKQVLAKGVFWSAVEKYSSMAVSIVVSMVLARLLTPEEFGVVAIATVLIQFLTLISNMGIAPAIIQRNDLTNVELDDIFSYSCFVGLLLALLFFAGSWFIADIYDVNYLVVICQILSIQVFFSAANMVPNALMTKYLRFKEIAKRTLLIQIITGVISIIAASIGAGVFALLISPVATSIGIFIYNRQFYKVRFSHHLSLSPIKKIFSYSSYQFLFQIIVYFSSNTDKILIGKYISAGDLGFYQKSHQLVQLPVGSVGSVVNPVLQPVLSKYQEDIGELSERYNRIIRLLATVSFPFGVLLYSCGAEIIRIFYGAQWDMAVPSFKIIAITAPIQIVLSSSGSFFQAANETKRLFQLGLVNAFISIMFVIVAVCFFQTIEAVAWAWSITNILGLLSTYFFMYVLVVRKSFRYFFSEFFFPLALSVITAIILNLEGELISYNIVCFIVKCITTAFIILFSVQMSEQMDIIELTKGLFAKRTNNSLK